MTGWIWIPCSHPGRHVSGDQTLGQVTSLFRPLLFCIHGWDSPCCDCDHLILAPVAIAGMMTECWDPYLSFLASSPAHEHGEYWAL